MPSLEDVSSHPSSQPVAPALPSAGKRFAHAWDFLAVLILMVASLPLAWVSPRTVISIQYPGSFDDHWVIDGAYKAQHHLYFGRDVSFLYGPLAHWLMSVAPRLPGLSLGSIYTSHRTLVLWCAILFSYFALRFLLPEQAAWKRFLLLLLLVIFWTSWDGRTSLGILLFVVFLRGWYAVLEERLNPALFAGGSAALIAFAFLYSADTGVYGIAAWGLGMMGVALENAHEWRRHFRQYVIACGVFAVSMIIVGLALSIVVRSPLDFFFFLKSSLALVGVHRWNEPYPLDSTGEIHLLVPAAIGVCVFLLRFLVKPDREDVLTAHTGFLLSAFLFALLAMQSGLVRSDPNHIVFGIFPMVFFSGAVLFSFSSRTASAIAALGAIVSSLAFSSPAPWYEPSSLRFRLARARHPITDCPGGYRDFDHVCYPASFAATMQSTTDFFRQNSGNGDSVVIFPYQYMFAGPANRNVAGGVEQSFLANGAYLSQAAIKGMQQASAPVGLYFSDAGPGQLGSSLLSLPIDNISNFTRTPPVWFWIFRNYHADRQFAPGMIGLRHDEARASRITMQEIPLTLTAGNYPVTSAPDTIDLGAPNWPSSGADFLRLRLRMKYSPLWKLRKPARLQLEITLANDTRLLRTFVVEPNVTSEVWFYPGNEADLINYFNADDSSWRSVPRLAVTDLRLIVTPMDWFSQMPQSVTIDSADAVRVSLSH